MEFLYSFDFRFYYLDRLNSRSKTVNLFAVCFSFLFITLGVETNFSRVSNGRRKEAVKIVECFFLRVCGVAVKETTWHFLDFLSCPPGTKNESSLCQCLSLVLLQKPT